ncbi:Cyclic nucleotide-binding domain-containing protein [Hymenobacter daecheongensis DSM 21074]|uniref:Cyclic nucleotide-binding domain-containing protein n=1 Tax=Hymenobacter daecheongensis DSM 21074 TaxID=1121955 RepID=A0A1M6L6K2_9BACT|nr:cyclic nucleotide-binding domain-containing protein [Hymenobacter daecheongensis]SHJ66826.1 Cyclic nucleotide-binding domain-containing protein [Hymenobacter daecheongensis DSM 21074]
MNTNTWYRFLGVRPNETKTVLLFFLHNLLLGLGTMLVFVAANVLLLRDEPAQNLPLAYCLGAAAMLVAGRAYAHYEQQWRLQKLAVRTLLATLVLTAVLSVVAASGGGVAAAVAVMVGYRVIYLLTNLGFWGMSAAMFSVRQGRRLFGALSAGDMPARGIGAVLGVFLCLRFGVHWLLLTAFGAYLLALYLQRRAFGQLAAVRRPVPPPAAPGLLQQLVGSPPLVRYMGLGLLALAGVAVAVEYLFFVGLAQHFTQAATQIQYLGGVLGLTYLLALLGRLLAARRGPDQLGVRRMLRSLPLVALAGVALFGTLRALGVGAAGQMLYFGGLYLGLEVLRRTLFEPAFLVLLQPLPPLSRLRAHTLLRTLCEPLGLGLGGLLLLALRPGAGAVPWAALAVMGVGLLAALGLLQRAYGAYILALKQALGLHPAQREAAPTTDALSALLHLHRAEAPLLVRHAEGLLTHPESQVRSRTLILVGHQVGPDLLRRLTLHDPDPAVREMACRLAGRHTENDDLLQHPDITVRKGAIRGRLELAPTDVMAQASLAAVAANASHHRQALELIRFLTPTQQVELVTSGLSSREPALVQAATAAAAAVSPAVLTSPLIGLLQRKTTRAAAADSLVRMGDATLPFLQTVLARETNERLLRHLTQVCARLGTPAGRRLLLQLVQDANLCGRAAALRALSSLPTVPTDAPMFQRLVEEEMRLAQHLLHGMVAASADLRTALRHELHKIQQRVLAVLMQLYERPPLVEAQRGLAHASGERQLLALEVLEHLIPRPLYQGLQALLDVGRLAEKIRTLDDLLGPAIQPEPILTTIVRRGTAAFSPWTVGVALRQWHPEPATVAHLYPHLQTSDPLIQETAGALLRRLPLQRPAAYDQLMLLYPSLAAHPLSDPAAASPVSFLERVRMLKNTALFGQTSENLLSTIVPIMHEVTFGPEEEIFAKGTLGTSLFIIYEGEVGIFNRHQLLTTFGRGEFFGELALLDAEPRSASAVALHSVRAFRIDQEDFYDVTENCAEVVRSIMHELCQRLRRQNERTAEPENEPVGQPA